MLSHQGRSTIQAIRPNQLKRVARVMKLFAALHMPRPLAFSAASLEEDVMKRISAPTLALYLFVAGAGFWLLSNPSHACAAEGSARCGNRTVTCMAPRCECADGIGCIGYDENGRRIPGETQLCTSGGEIGGEESSQ